MQAERCEASAYNSVHTKQLFKKMLCNFKGINMDYNRYKS